VCLGGGVIHSATATEMPLPAIAAPQRARQRPAPKKASAAR